MFKDNLISLRKLNHLSQEELADQLHISRQTLSKYETGESLPDIEKCKAMADVRADYPGKHMTKESSAILEDGKRVWKTYETLYVDGEDFEEIGQEFENTCKVKKESLGNGMLTFMKQRELADFAVKWMEQHRHAHKF